MEGEQLAFLRPVIALGEDRHGPSDLEAAVDVLEERFVAVALADDRHVAASRPYEPPLELARHQQRGVGEEVESRLDGKQEQESELVEPVQVVGDDDVVAAVGAGDVLAALDLELEGEPEQGDADEADDAVRDVGARSYR